MTTRHDVNMPLLEDEDGAPYPEEVQLAYAAQVIEAEQRGREQGRREVVDAIHQLCQSLPNDRYRSLPGDMTEVHITDRELGDLVSRFVSRPNLPGGGLDG